MLRKRWIVGLSGALFVVVGVFAQIATTTPDKIAAAARADIQKLRKVIDSCEDQVPACPDLHSYQAQMRTLEDLLGRVERR